MLVHEAILLRDTHLNAHTQHQKVTYRYMNMMKCVKMKRSPNSPTIHARRPPRGWSAIAIASGIGEAREER